MMVIEGNHEIEAQAGGATFVSYKSRYIVPSQESGSNSRLYYSFNAGGIHFIMLGGYVDYNRTGESSLQNTLSALTVLVASEFELMFKIYVSLVPR